MNSGMPCNFVSTSMDKDKGKHYVTLPRQQHGLDLPMDLPRLVGLTPCPVLPLRSRAVRRPRPCPTRAKGLAVDLLLGKCCLHHKSYMKAIMAS
ncbi:unnamed protein product [Prunus armeniaca]